MLMQAPEQMAACTHNRRISLWSAGRVTVLFLLHNGNVTDSGEKGYAREEKKMHKMPKNSMSPYNRLAEEKKKTKR